MLACFCFTSLSGVLNSELVVPTDNHFVALGTEFVISGSVWNSLKTNRANSVDVKL